MLRLTREHGQSPGWWDTLDRRDHIHLLADLRLRMTEEAKDMTRLLQLLARR